MNDFMKRKLREALFFDLDNLAVQPQAIIMSPEFHEKLEKPAGFRGVPITVNRFAKKHWCLKF
jgi:hypothetical protein